MSKFKVGDVVCYAEQENENDRRNIVKVDEDAAYYHAYNDPTQPLLPVTDEENWTLVQSNTITESASPEHYGDWKVGEFIEERGLDFNEGSVVKYICRWRKKDGVKDLKKARDYIDRLLFISNHIDIYRKEDVE